MAGVLHTYRVPAHHSLSHTDHAWSLRSPSCSGSCVSERGVKHRPDKQRSTGEARDERRARVRKRGVLKGNDWEDREREARWRHTHSPVPLLPLSPARAVIVLHMLRVDTYVPQRSLARGLALELLDGGARVVYVRFIVWGGRLLS